MRRSMRRSWTAAIATVFVVSSTALCAAAPAFISSHVTLRDGPGTNFPAIIVVPKGTEVEVLGCARGWCEVELGDDEGFMRQDLLNFLDDGPPIVVFPPVFYDQGNRYWREHDRGAWESWRRDRGRPDRRYQGEPRRNDRQPAQPRPPERAVRPGGPPIIYRAPDNRAPTQPSGRGPGQPPGRTQAQPAGRAPNRAGGQRPAQESAPAAPAEPQAPAAVAPPRAGGPPR